MEEYVPSLDLSAFAGNIPEWTDEEVTKAIEASERRSMSVGLHDCKITAIVKDSVKICESDPKWFQFGITLTNAANETTNQMILVPLTRDNMYTGKTGKQSEYPFANFSKFCREFGWSQNDFVRHMIMTETSGVADLIGAQVRVKMTWNSKRVHLEYDRDSATYFICDAKGTRLFDDPFKLPDVDPSKSSEERRRERYAEVEEFCRANGLMLQLYPDARLERMDSVKNPPLGKPKKGIKAPAVVVDEDDDEEDEEEAPPPPVTTKKKKKKKKSAPPPPPPPPEDDEEEDDEDDDDDEEDEDVSF